MITITISGLLITILFLIISGLSYWIYRLKEQIKANDAEFDNNLKELETLVEQNKTRVEEQYQEVIDKHQQTITFYEDFMVSLNTAIKFSADRLKEIDLKGTFQGDDEVGWFFKNVKEIQDVLNKFKVELLQRKFDNQ